jgi:uncharacterized SAM-binding protein YcdF (DUF218 family)
VTRRPVVGSVIQLLGWATVGAILVAGYMAVRISTQGDRDDRQPVDAIVVLGAAQFNGTPSDVFEARLQHALALYEAGVAPYLVVTGGKLPADRTTEAATARSWAIAHGVPASAILSENHGRNTLESLEAVAVLFRERGLRSAVFVSDQTHMLRVLRMARDQGIVGFGSPTRTSPSDLDPARRQRAMIHEIAGLIAYYLGGGHQFDDTTISSGP